MMTNSKAHSINIFCFSKNIVPRLTKVSCSDHDSKQQQTPSARNFHGFLEPITQAFGVSLTCHPQAQSCWRISRGGSWDHPPNPCLRHWLCWCFTDMVRGWCYRNFQLVHWGFSSKGRRGCGLREDSDALKSSCHLLFPCFGSMGGRRPFFHLCSSLPLVSSHHICWWPCCHPLSSLPSAQSQLN